MSLSRRYLLPFAPLLAACPPETALGELVPEIAVTPDALAFGDQAVPVPITAAVTVANAGRATLIADLTVESPDGDSVFSVADPHVEVPPGTAAVVPVTFTPATFLDFSATLVVTSNDADTPALSVPLSGTGADLPVPDIAVSPLALDFGDVTPDTVASDFLLLQNLGDADLTLGTLSSSGSGAFSLVTDPSRTVVAGGGEVPVLLQYAPTSLQGDATTLTFPSNDPDEPVTEVALLGNGGGTFDWPQAVITCPGDVQPPTPVDLTGADSVDPNGDVPLLWDWTLSDRPRGSRAELTNSSTANTRFFADIAGTYEVQLTVENTQGVRSAPDRCTIEAIPSDALHIELTWDTPRADLDLHVIDGDGTFYATPEDCTWCNPRPRWGAAGGADNPRLDLDDRGGFGPENVNVEEPHAGTTDVKVHYFSEHGDDAVVATVRVYVRGALASEQARALRRNDVWDVARVTWPAGTVGVLSTPLYTAPARACQ